LSFFGQIWAEERIGDACARLNSACQADHGKISDEEQGLINCMALEMREYTKNFVHNLNKDQDEVARPAEGNKAKLVPCHNEMCPHFSVICKTVGSFNSTMNEVTTLELIYTEHDGLVVWPHSKDLPSQSTLPPCFHPRNKSARGGNDKNEKTSKKIWAGTKNLVLDPPGGPSSFFQAHLAGPANADTKVYCITLLFLRL
jgi:hypothetical protein